MRILAGVLQVVVGLLFTGVGAILYYAELFGERPDWASVLIGVLMLLAGVGLTWAGLVRATRR
jgi:hypothetical protein